MLSWDKAARKLHTVTRERGAPLAAYILVSPETPVWQLGDGWEPRQNNFRWIGPRAPAVPRRPENAVSFEVLVNAGDQLIRDRGSAEIAAFLDGHFVGKQEFTAPGWHRAAWSAPPGAPGRVTVEFRAPTYRPGGEGDAPSLGIAIGAFGFR